MQRDASLLAEDLLRQPFSQDEMDFQVVHLRVSMDAFSGPGGGVGGDGGLYEFGSCYLCSAGADPRGTCRLEDHLGPGTRVRETEQQQDPSRRPLLGLTG
ncbi:unnamed protein product [Gadus morhua 'NCC']